jgi:membrane fusion protein
MSNPAARTVTREPERDHAPVTREDDPLFRPEVLAARQTRWLGTVLLEPKISSALFVLAAGIAAAAVLALLFLGSFTRKAHISGWLMPEQGLARIFAPQTGVVTRLLAREGMHVTKGTPLVVLSSEVQSETLGATREEIVRHLASRRDSMVRAKELQARLFEEQSAELQRRLQLMNDERRYFDRQVALQRTRLELSENSLARDRTMRGRDLSTIQRSNPTEQDYVERAAAFQALQSRRASYDRELLSVQSQLRELPLRSRNELAQVDRSVAELEQQLAEAEARRQIIVSAPEDGTVTGIQTELGGNATANVPLMSLVPAGSVLQAQLFGPSNAIGFIRPGQQVLLRYQAFPYQKFGMYEGVIKSVSGSAVSPAEMTQQLAGLANLNGANEPVYRVTVDLARQTAMAYGQPVPLQPGMRVEADVMIETRHLIEWVLDPLYSLTGKLK